MPGFGFKVGVSVVVGQDVVIISDHCICFKELLIGFRDWFPGEGVRLWSEPVLAKRNLFWSSELMLYKAC